MRRWDFFQANRPAREMVSVQMALVDIRRRQRLRRRGHSVCANPRWVSIEWLHNRALAFGGQSMTYRMRGFRMAKVSLLLGSLLLAVAIACGSDDDPAPVATAATAPTASTAPTAVSAPDASAPATATASAAPVATAMAPGDSGGPSGDVVMAIRWVNSVSALLTRVHTVVQHTSRLVVLTSSCS